jgi:hypothetical protein
MPQYSGGLWLAVKFIAPEAPRALTAKAIAGVGVGLSHKSGSKPFEAMIRADSAAKTSAMNLVSYPMIT